MLWAANQSTRSGVRQHPALEDVAQRVDVAFAVRCGHGGHSPATSRSHASTAKGRVHAGRAAGASPARRATLRRWTSLSTRAATRVNAAASTTEAWLSRTVSHTTTAHITATRHGVTPRASCRPEATTSASVAIASPSDSTDRSHITTGTVHENATTPSEAAHRARGPGTTVHTDAASALQQTVATAACQMT